MTFEEIDKARKTLGLGKTATLKEIKEAYKSLSKEYHPDMEDGDNEKFIELRKAYQLMMEYIQEYEYSFEPEEVRKQHPDEALWENYASDWMWGRGKKK